MTAREEVARLLAEHALSDFELEGCDGGTICRCGAEQPDGDHRGHVADVLLGGGALAGEHRHKAFVFHGAPADLPCQVCGETGWSTPNAEIQKNWADVLADAGRYELERMKRELDEQ